LAIYGSVHLYVFVKLKKGMSLGSWAGVPVALFMVVMVLAPIIVRMAERLGYELFAYITAHIGYTWMGWLFIFFSASLFFDIYRLLLAFGRLIFQKYFLSITPTAAFSCTISIILAFIIICYGFFEGLNIQLDRIQIKTDKLPKNISNLKIVQISDIHLGIIVGEMRLGRILQQVKAANPDILVSTGDLVDSQMDNLDPLTQMFREIDPPYGKYAVTGNHEFYAGLSNSLDFTKKAGFTILRGESRTPANIINIVGVDDPAGKPFDPAKNVSEKELLSKLPRKLFTLLLKHQPIVDKGSLGLFDLQLSGHTHKGQLFPFNLITGLVYKTNSGYAKLEQNSMIYVSRGSGTWGPPVRFLAPPEVTLIELIPNEKVSGLHS
jgi:predicted MPP superfamily phosphohydrolase